MDISQIDFYKGVDVNPLVKLGFKKEKAMELMLNLMPIIQMELQAKIWQTLGEEEMERIAKGAMKKGIKPEKEGMFLIEEAYFKKTGNYYLEEVRLLLNKYVPVAVKLVCETREGVKAFEKLDKKDQKEIERLGKKEKYREIEKIMKKAMKKP
jgi:hypothetical protein